MTSARNPPPPQWSEEADAILRHAKCETGLSASRIAALLAARCGMTVSRNAVLGRAFRLGLTRPRRPGAGLGVASRPPAAVKKTGAAKQAARRTAALNKAFAAAQWPWGHHDPLPRGAPQMGLLQLQAGRCRWPVGDKTGIEQMFCGAVTAPATPYCPGHHLCAYRPPPPLWKLVVE